MPTPITDDQVPDSLMRLAKQACRQYSKSESAITSLVEMLEKSTNKDVRREIIALAASRAVALARHQQGVMVKIATNIRTGTPLTSSQEKRMPVSVLNDPQKLRSFGAEYVHTLMDERLSTGVRLADATRPDLVAEAIACEDTANGHHKRGELYRRTSEKLTNDTEQVKDRLTAKDLDLIWKAVETSMMARRKPKAALQAA